MENFSVISVKRGCCATRQIQSLDAIRVCLHAICCRVDTVINKNEIAYISDTWLENLHWHGEGKRVR